MEVGNPLHPAGHVDRTRNFSVGLFLVVVVSEHEAQQQAWHDDIADAQHGEVAAWGAREHQLSRQGEAGDVPSHAGAQVQLAWEHVEGVVGRLRGHLHHHVTVKDVGREEDLQEITEMSQKTDQLALLFQACASVFGVMRDRQKCLYSQHGGGTGKRFRIEIKNDLM